MKKRHSLVTGMLLAGAAAVGTAFALHVLRKRDEAADYAEFEAEEKDFADTVATDETKEP